MPPQVQSTDPDLAGALVQRRPRALQVSQQYRDTRDVYYTHVFQDMRESLDHVLVSEQLYDHSYRRLWMFDGLAIYNDHLIVEDHKERGSGDHGVVLVTSGTLPLENRR